jgi:hypothetical protein
MNVETVTCFRATQSIMSSYSLNISLVAASLETIRKTDVDCIFEDMFTLYREDLIVIVIVKKSYRKLVVSREKVFND